MEVLLAAYLLFQGGSPELKQKLNDFLAFYRENRELILLLANAKKNEDPQRGDEKQKGSPSSSEEKSDPIDLSVFEQFLNAKSG